MAEFTKPNLPDPGENRWWEIRLDGEEWALLLLKPDPVWQGGIEVAVEIIHDSAASVGAFESRAQRILNRLNRAAAFIGTYHKKEEN